MEEKINNNHGGRREGAGRPKTTDSVRSIGIRIPKDIADILDKQPNRSRYIIEAIRFYELHR